MNTVILPETAEAKITTATAAVVNPLFLNVTADVAANTITIAIATVTADAEGRLKEPMELQEQHGRPKDAATHSPREIQAAEAVDVKMNATAAADADNHRSGKAR